MPHEFLDQLGPSDPALSFFEKAFVPPTGTMHGQVD